MEQVKLSQHTAILLEHARKEGITEEQLQQAVAARDAAVFQALENEDYEYGDLFIYAEEHGEKLEQAMTDGYRMTFNTRNGLKIWLEEAFHLNSETDFTVGEGRIDGLHLTNAQFDRLKQSLAVNWVVAAEETLATGGKKVSLCLKALA